MCLALWEGGHAAVESRHQCISLVSIKRPQQASTAVQAQPDGTMMHMWAEVIVLSMCLRRC